jgi:hypothetical protein
VEIEVQPEPSEPVRGAIAAALAAVEGGEPESAWWRAGILGAVGADEDWS